MMILIRHFYILLKIKNNIQIKKKIIGNKNFDRLNLTFSHDLDFQYLDILETNELNDLIKKSNLR